MSDSRIDVALEAVFSAGLLGSALLLLLGLVLSQEPLLRWGVMLLLATPAGATAVLAVGLLSKREWFFAAACVWVLLVLFSSLIVALRS